MANKKSPFAAATRPKPDKDMGTEVNNLGGYRPGQRLEPSPVRGYQFLEIVIVRPRSLRRAPRRRSIEIFGEPLIQFTPYV